MRVVLVILAFYAGAFALLWSYGEPLPQAELTFVSGSEHNDFDPQRMSWHHDIRVAHCLYDTLVSVDFSDFSVHPAVAERWETSPDGLTYTFHLRRDAKWSDGSPVTAQDFVYGWRRAMLPDLAADYTQLTWVIKGAKTFYDRRTAQLAEYVKIAERAGSSTMSDPDAARALYDLTLRDFADTVGLATPDDHTLIVTLEQPTPYFLELTAFPTFSPVHRASVEQTLAFDPASGSVVREPTYWSDPERLVTNGPYTLAVRAFRRGLHLKANPHYWNRAAMRNATVNELIISNPQTALQAYEDGQANIWFDPPSASSLAAELVAQGRNDVIRQPMAGTYFYNFNCLPKLHDGRDNPLANARVRRALAMAIDRDTLIRNVTRLGQPVAKTYIPIGALGNYDPPVERGVGFDVEEARRLLKEAGYEGGRGLTGLSILYNNGMGHEYLAQAVKAMWEANLGVVVTLEGVETKVLGQRLKSQDFTIARASWFGDYPDPTTWLQKMSTGDGNNDCRWSNAEFDALLARAATEADPARRLGYLREAEGILLDEQPMALIYQYVSLYLIKPEVTGLRPNPWHRWVLEDAAVAKAERD